MSDKKKTYLEQDLPGHQIGRQAEKDDEQCQRQELVRHVLQLSSSAGGAYELDEMAGWSWTVELAEYL